MPKAKVAGFPGVREAMDAVMAATAWGPYRVCDLAGITPPTFYKAKNGTNAVPGTAAMRLARAWRKHVKAKPADELAMARKLAALDD
jgi:hypothetical protein